MLPTACPKPPKREPTPRKRIRAESDKHKLKRLSQLSGPQRKTIPKRSKPIVKINRRRKLSEFARAYGSKQRVAWVRQQGCVVCAVVSPIAKLLKVKQSQVVDNAHTATGGMGYKAGYETIVPLCRKDHIAFDQRIWPLNSEKNREWIKAQAAQTQQRWLLHCGRVGIDPTTGKAL